MSASITHSYLSAAVRLTQDQDLYAKYTSDCAMDQIEPLTVGDAQAFMDVTFDIRNTLFQLPRCMTLAKYRMILQTAIEAHSCPEMVGLDPFLVLSTAERTSMLRNVSSEGVKWCKGLLVIGVKTSGKEIAEAPLAARSEYKFTHHMLSLSRSVHVDVSIRMYEVIEVESEDVREFWMRQAIAQSKDVPTRVLLLLSDGSVPSFSIPSYETRRAIYNKARDLMSTCEVNW